MAARFDAPVASRLERMYAAPEIAAQRRRTRAVLAARAGEHGLDVGCGPGYLVAEIAREIGPDGTMTGVDSSDAMLALAAARIEQEGLGARVVLRRGTATRLDMADATLDFVTAIQVYLHVPDVATALSEAYRVLRPGGRLAVLDTDWDGCLWHTSDRDRHRRVMEARLADFAQPHLPPRLPGLLRGAGFRLTLAEAIPIVDLEGRPDSFSAGLVEAACEHAVRHGVSEPDILAWAADLGELAQRGDYFFSVSRFLFLAERTH